MTCDQFNVQCLIVTFPLKVDSDLLTQVWKKLQGVPKKSVNKEISITFEQMAFLPVFTRV